MSKLGLEFRVLLKNNLKKGFTGIPSTREISTIDPLSIRAAQCWPKICGKGENLKVVCTLDQGNWGSAQRTNTVSQN